MILSCPQNFCLNLCYTVSPPFILEIWKLFVKWQLQILIDADKKLRDSILSVNFLVKPTWLEISAVKQKPMDVNVTVGGNHTFVCDGEGKPRLTTKWYIDSKEGNLYYQFYFSIQSIVSCQCQLSVVKN